MQCHALFLYLVLFSKTFIYIKTVIVTAEFFVYKLHWILVVEGHRALYGNAVASIFTPSEWMGFVHNDDFSLV